MSTFAMPAPNPVVGALMSFATAGRRRVDLTDTGLAVQLGWAWWALVPRSSIIGARRRTRGTVNIGAHGWRGHWVVNTVGRNLVVLTLDPPAEGRCLGVPILVRELTLSLEDPTGFLSELEVPLV